MPAGGKKSDLVEELRDRVRALEARDDGVEALRQSDLVIFHRSFEELRGRVRVLEERNDGVEALRRRLDFALDRAVSAEVHVKLLQDYMTSRGVTMPPIVRLPK